MRQLQKYNKQEVLFKGIATQKIRSKLSVGILQCFRNVEIVIDDLVFTFNHLYIELPSCYEAGTIVQDTGTVFKYRNFRTNDKNYSIKL